MEVVGHIMVVMAVKVKVVLVEILVDQWDGVVVMVVEVVVQMHNIPILKQALVEVVLLELFGVLEENFQTPLLMINNI